MWMIVVLVWQCSAFDRCALSRRRLPHWITLE
jgi:hypothetical protein